MVTENVDTYSFQCEKVLLYTKAVYLIMHACLLSRFSHVQFFITLWTIQPTRLFCPWASRGKNTRVDCHFLLQGIFLTQGLNLSLLHLWHCRQVLLLLSHQGSPYLMITYLKQPLHLKTKVDSLSCYTPIHFLTKETCKSVFLIKIFHTSLLSALLLFFYFACFSLIETN